LELNRLGYGVDAFVLDAASFVPQSRQRLFVAAKQELRQEPARVLSGLRFYQSEVRPAALADFILMHDEINWSIRALPPLPSSDARLTDILDDLPSSSAEWWSAERSAYLLSQMSVRHRKIADEMIAADAFSYGTVFRRVRYGKSMAELRTDGIAGCLRTPRGGSGRQILVKAGKGEFHARLLSPAECARLMGADGFRVAVPSNQALFGFGDAVCAPVITWIAENYLNPLVDELIDEGRAARISGDRYLGG
ncbi:MAG TPA: DNA cytosine methyltransferase, partial [Chthonomonadaceae bacterium]|nr:DNA cytosine methyltransferase [Chthonomonadaceae bacterium]